MRKATASLFLLSFSFVLVSSCKSADSEPSSDVQGLGSMFAQEDQITISVLQSYDTNVVPLASTSKATGGVLYRTYSYANMSPTSKRIRTCVIQHGYGGTVSLVSFLGKNEERFENFVSGYYGKSAVKNLLAGPCSQVLITLHESHDTDILRSIMRTEEFLKNVACRPSYPLNNSQIACALIGHSKGGAIVTNIARRCMQKTSILEEDGCAQIGEVYSETGIIRGTSLGFLIYGAKISNNKKLLRNLTLLTAGGVRQFSDQLWNVDGDHIPGQTNPMWFDISPFATVENDVPVWVANNIQLNKEGWLVADVAASVTQNTFSGNFFSDLVGCGTFQGDIINQTICRFYQISTASVHQKDLEKIFMVGLKAIKNDKKYFYKGSSDYLNTVSWGTYQSGDGLADFEGAISACYQGGTAIKKCTRLQNINHWVSAGAAKESIDDVVAELSK